MYLIKLNAVTSTNDYLKSLASKQYLENFTVITARNQTAGKGQMGASWVSEPDKNMIASILVKDILTNVNEVFHLNIITSVAMLDTLNSLKIKEISIKWPNDIMSGSKKIGGILIENIFKSNQEIFSIIGIGLNVNQTKFDDLKKASSLCLIYNRTFDLEEILNVFIEKLRFYIAGYLSGQKNNIWDYYHKNLFKINTPMPFEQPDGSRFMGIIKGVNESGKLKVQFENDSIQLFGLKELTLLY